MSSVSSRVTLVVLLLVVLVQSLLVAGQCPNGPSQEVTTPGLVDGEVPGTGVLQQGLKDVLTLWPISSAATNIYHGNVTAFVAALGVCESPSTDCAQGTMQLGLYHYHVYGTYTPKETGRFHLISYSDPFTYYPNSASGTSTQAGYAVVDAHPEKPSQQTIPASQKNKFDGYYIGILSTVPYGFYTSGITVAVPMTMTFDPSVPRQGKKSGILPANPLMANFQAQISQTEAALGFFFCPAAAMGTGPN